ncbi:MAG: Gfo/Idh/MocA family oxidoreductase [Candidatus Acidiferrales bacterium]
MGSRPRIAVVGCGYWGKNLIRNFHKLGSLTVLCDVSVSSLTSLASQYGAEACKSYEDVLARTDIDAVVIATPAAQHYSMVKAALLAGKDVFVEKPLALQLSEGEELVELARKGDRVLMVGHLLYYHPAIHELKQLIRKGALGRVEYVYSSRLNFGKLRTEENILWSFAPHDISAILYLLDEDPETVAAHGGAYLNPQIADLTLTSFKFASGVTSHIFVSWLHPFKEQKLVIVGDQQMAVFDDTERERKLVLYPHRVDWIDRLPVAHRSEGQVIALPAEEPLLNECKHFLECVETRQTPKTDGRNGVRVLRVLNASEQSLKQNGQVQRLDAMRRRYFVHATALVDDPCEVGDGTHIWHFSHVMSGSTIGKNCNLGQNVHVASGVRIGNNVKIQNNVSVYTGVELESDVFCGPSMVFTNVTNPRSHVNRKNEYKRTLVRKGASLGANSTIVCGTTIGEYAFVGAGAVVTRDVPDYALVVGAPARRVGWMCGCGVRLNVANGHCQCSSCGQSYLLDGEHLVALSDVPFAAAGGKSPLSQLHAPLP